VVAPSHSAPSRVSGGVDVIGQSRDTAAAPSPIAGYEDWPAAARAAAPFDGPTTAATALGRLLGVHRQPTPKPVDEEQRVVDGVLVRRLRWSVGYGPDTIAWLLRPVGVRGRLPGVLGMHCHGGIRSVGGEQLVDLGAGSLPRAAQLRDVWYSSQAPANELARRGFVVLVHDTFSWGSRRFDLSRPSPRLAGTLAAYAALWREQHHVPSPDEWFDLASSLHEDTLAKTAGTLGQTLAGAVLTDDLVALDLLAREEGVDATRLSTFGFSGGGGRSLLLAALDHRVGACVVACMMATFSSLVPSSVDAHSWLLHVPGLWSFADWPDLTRLARARFLVQYRLADPLFPRAGMESAHQRLTALHPEPGRYHGSFAAGGHVFDALMQDEAGTFLTQSAAATATSTQFDTDRITRKVTP
jgi:dienelactone hydrolase